MKKSIEISVEEAQVLLDKLSEVLPVKYGAVFNLVQQFFQGKFVDDKQQQLEGGNNKE